MVLSSPRIDDCQLRHRGRSLVWQRRAPRRSNAVPGQASCPPSPLRTRLDFGPPSATRSEAPARPLGTPHCRGRLPPRARTPLVLYCPKRTSPRAGVDGPRLPGRSHPLAPPTLLPAALKPPLTPATRPRPPLRAPHPRRSPSGSDWGALLSFLTWRTLDFLRLGPHDRRQAPPLRRAAHACFAGPWPRFCRVSSSSVHASHFGAERAVGSVAGGAH